MKKPVLPKALIIADIVLGVLTYTASSIAALLAKIPFIGKVLSFLMTLIFVSIGKFVFYICLGITLLLIITRIFANRKAKKEAQENAQIAANAAVNAQLQAQSQVQGISASNNPERELVHPMQVFK